MFVCQQPTAPHQSVQPRHCDTQHSLLATHNVHYTSTQQHSTVIHFYYHNYNFISWQLLNNNICTAHSGLRHYPDRILHMLSCHFNLINSNTQVTCCSMTNGVKKCEKPGPCLVLKKSNISNAHVAVLSLCNKQMSCHILWVAPRRHTAIKQFRKSPTDTKSPLDLWRKNPRLISSYYRADGTENVSIKRSGSYRCLHLAGDTRIRRFISSTCNANASNHAATQMRWDCAHAIGRDESH